MYYYKKSIRELVKSPEKSFQEQMKKLKERREEKELEFEFLKDCTYGYRKSSKRSS